MDWTVWYANWWFCLQFVRVIVQLPSYSLLELTTLDRPCKNHGTMCCHSSISALFVELHKFAWFQRFYISWTSHSQATLLVQFLSRGAYVLFLFDRYNNSGSLCTFTLKCQSGFVFNLIVWHLGIDFEMRIIRCRTICITQKLRLMINKLINGVFGGHHTLYPSIL
jgi:hypothetical protein